jgi:hypothetical protein
MGSDRSSPHVYLHSEALTRAHGSEKSPGTLAPETGLVGHAAAAFRSILFPPGLETLRDERTDAPACFADLNLDQVMAAVVAKRDEEVLRPIFNSPCRNEEIVRHRQAVFADLERPGVLKIFPAFQDAMRSLRANLGYADKIGYECHKHMVFLRAARLYSDGVAALLRDLQSVELRSPGLRHLRAYLRGYLSSAGFRQLAAETRELREILSRINFGMLFRGDKVTVRRYASEPDYTVTIRERFARFREADVETPARSAPTDEFGLNHIEEGILEFVGRLFPEQFRRLADYVARHVGFVDEVVARFDREIGFFLAYLDFIDPLKRAGLPFCHPDVSLSSKEVSVVAGFDLALAAKLVREGGQVVRNDFHLTGAERLLVVSGPNQGGKTTFARMFGQLCVLAGLGCPVPGEAARIFLADRIFTHFEREEDIANLRGKLEEELVRLHRTCEAMTADSVVILNEIFNSTSLDDQAFLGTEILKRVLAADAIGVCVTFIDALSRLCEKTVSMVSVVDPDDPARRTFEIVRRPADGLAYALSLARKHGVTYEQLRTRVRP